MTESAQTRGMSARARLRDRVIAAAALTLTWVLLWGVFSWFHLVSGIVVAVIVLTVFPLPPVTFAGRLHVRAMLRLAVRFLTDLVKASVQLAALAYSWLWPITWPLLALSTK